MDEKINWNVVFNHCGLEIAQCYLWVWNLSFSREFSKEPLKDVVNDDTFVHPSHAIAKKNVDREVMEDIFTWFGECM